MEHIKEVEFLIKSPPLTEKERKEISEFIKERKSKRSERTLNKKEDD